MPERSIIHYWSALLASNVANQSNDIAIITDEPGWHGRVLTEALRTRGYNSRYLSLTDCQLHLDRASDILTLPGFSSGLPAGVFVRGVPGGSLEQVIFRLNILHILHDQGIAVFNTGRAIEHTVDKSMTSYRLHKAGIPTPPTYVFESSESAQALLTSHKRLGKELVIKPLFGSQGIGVQKLTAELLHSHDVLTNGLYYLQEFVQQKQNHRQDIRVLVIGGHARKAMLRKGVSWITNRTQGARCVTLALDKPLRAMAEAASAAVDIDYCGVDLIVDATGQLQVLELNSIPAWWGLQQVVDDDIAGLLIDAFVKKIQRCSAALPDKHVHG